MNINKDFYWSVFLLIVFVVDSLVLVVFMYVFINIYILGLDGI